MLFFVKLVRHKQRCHLKCICDALDEACSSLCNDTPASLMCYASRLVTIGSWARLSACVFSSPSGTVISTEGSLWQREGPPVALLDVSSTSQTSGGLIPPPGFAEAAFSQPFRRHYGAERVKQRLWARILCNVYYRCRIFLFFFFFLLALCIWSSCRVSSFAQDGSVPAAVWTFCVWNVGEERCFGKTSM